MITLVFYMKDGKCCGFHCTGHADYAKRGRDDIVCAGVSALVINCVNSIEKLTEDRADIEQADGSVFCMIKSPVSTESELFLKSLRLGVEYISKEYRRYVRIVEEE